MFCSLDLGHPSYLGHPHYLGHPYYLGHPRRPPVMNIIYRHKMIIVYHHVMFMISSFRHRLLHGLPQV